MEQAILETLIYADLFDFPLTRREIWQRLIWGKRGKPKEKDFEAALKRLEKKEKILKKSLGKREFYFLSGREAIVRVRQRREEEAKRKLKKARRIVKFLGFCPWAWLIGVSGSVAADNALPRDDIDLFVITAPRRLWLTRFWLVLILELLRDRRRPKDKRFSDKICLNLLLAADHLDYFAQEQDLFLAYELAQLRPLFIRHNVYNQFLSANLWSQNFLPNHPTFQVQKLSIPVRSDRNRQLVTGLFGLIFDWFEKLAYWLQLTWMQRRRTRERATTFLAAFHPNDFRHQILKKFCDRLALFALMTKGL